MKKIAFDVVTAYESHDDALDENVRMERTKTFYGEESYQQALAYYEKRKQAFDILYQTEEGGLYCRTEMNGKEYTGEYREWVVDETEWKWTGIHLDVRVMNF